jgi:hypothetical protein
MGRILKLLTSALAQCNGNVLSAHVISSDIAVPGTALLSLGDAAEGSPNASAMLRIAILSAWAQLTSAISQQKYLQEVVKPHRPALTSLWIAALRDYANIRGDSEAILDTSSAPLDAAYASLGKDILLPVSRFSLYVLRSRHLAVLRRIMARYVERCGNRNGNAGSVHLWGYGRYRRRGRSVFDCTKCKTRADNDVLCYFRSSL